MMSDSSTVESVSGPAPALISNPVEGTHIFNYADKITPAEVSSPIVPIFRTTEPVLMSALTDGVFEKVRSIVVVLVSMHGFPVIS
jgi:hypothetical protein